MEFRLPDLKLCPMPEWETQRRKWLSLVEECLYGKAPECRGIRTEVIGREPILDGKAVKEQVRIRYGTEEGHFFDATVWAPAAKEQYPAITWNQFSNEQYDCCPYEEAVAERGYIIASFEREQVVRDAADGPVPLYDAYPGYSWGAVRAWAWAQSRLADYLLTREDTDPDKLVCTGFSRGGKAALAAGIFDTRFSICAPINAGAGGTGCFRYLGDKNGFCQDVTKVESLGRVGSVFPFWWTENYSRWWPSPDPVRMGLEQNFPLDCHTLKALIAPRNLFTSDGIDDAWSNPCGTALTFRAAQPAFDLLGGRSAAFFRSGGHAFGTEDWHALLDFCDEVYRGKETGRGWDTCPFEDL